MSNVLPPVAETRADRLAETVSRVLNPFVTGPSSLFTGIYLTTQSVASAASWTLVSLVVVVFPSSAYILRKLRRHEITDIYVSLREQRPTLYLISQVSLVVCFLGSQALQAPPVVVLGFGSAALANGAIYFVNRYTKISAHAAASAAGNALLFNVSAGFGLMTIPLTLLVGWSRLRTQAHTRTQVAAGWIVATSSVLVVARLLS